MNTVIEIETEGAAARSSGRHEHCRQHSERPTLKPRERARAVSENEGDGNRAANGERERPKHAVEGEQRNQARDFGDNMTGSPLPAAEASVELRRHFCSRIFLSRASCSPLRIPFSAIISACPIKLTLSSRAACSSLLALAALPAGAVAPARESGKNAQPA